MLINHSLLGAPIYKNYSSGIDFLRAILALWVVIAHIFPWANYVTGVIENVLLSNLLNLLSKIFQPAGETHPAVLGFIVLSGYCIHRSGARDGKKFDFFKYGVRRAFRIYPVYFLATFIGILFYNLSSDIFASKAVNLTGTKEINFFCVVGKLFGISAFIPSLHYCSFQGNAPLTTVMVEIWLYVVYGLVIFFIPRFASEKQVRIFILSIYLASLITVVVYPEMKGWWHNGSIFSFLILWWIGAYFVMEENISQSTFFIVFSVWIFSTVFIIFLKYNSLLIIEFRKILFAFLFASFTKWMDDNPRWWQKLGKHIGAAGYSIYAFHAPLIIYSLLAFGSLKFSLIVSLVVAAVLYCLFEKPLTNLGKRLSS